MHKLYLTDGSFSVETENAIVNSRKNSIISQLFIMIHYYKWFIVTTEMIFDNVKTQTKTEFTSVV